MKTAPAPCSTSPDISKRLKACKDHILQTWVDRMRAEIPVAKRTSRSYLVNSLPEFLERLVHALAEKSPKLSDAKEMAQEHAKERLDLTDFSLPNILNEYKILRQVIFDLLEEGGPIPIRERNIMLDFVQTGMVEVASAFSRFSEERLSDLHKVENELRDQFIATLSHDMKTPLAAARLSAQILARRLSESDQGASITRVVRSIDRADKMLEILLDVNLIRAGQDLPLEMEKCDLSQLLTDEVAELTALHGDRFELFLPNEPVIGFWSPVQLRRCVENLANNAIKYGFDTAPVTITLKQEGKGVKIQVHNTGTPIPADQLSGIFDPYKRAQAPALKGKRGWGLGLTLVQGVVKAHGGRVSAKSNTEEGTTFTIDLPLDGRRD